ncbi:MAG: hypothetical protein ACRCS9_11295 [Hyphomicrobium sp.]
MNHQHRLLSAGLAALIAVGSAAGTSSTAHADPSDYVDAQHEYAPERRGYRGGNRWDDRRSARHGRHDDGRDHGGRRHRDHTARNVAIGAFATILGIAIASEAARANDRGDYGDED